MTLCNPRASYFRGSRTISRWETRGRLHAPRRLGRKGFPPRLPLEEAGGRTTRATAPVRYGRWTPVTFAGKKHLIDEEVHGCRLVACFGVHRQADCGGVRPGRDLLIAELSTRRTDGRDGKALPPCVVAPGAGKSVPDAVHKFLRGSRGQEPQSRAVTRRIPWDRAASLES
jgi:hypothetical protein